MPGTWRKCWSVKWATRWRRSRGEEAQQRPRNRVVVVLAVARCGPWIGGHKARRCWRCVVGDGTVRTGWSRGLQSRRLGREGGGGGKGRCAQRSKVKMPRWTRTQPPTTLRSSPVLVHRKRRAPKIEPSPCAPSQPQAAALDARDAHKNADFEPVRTAPMCVLALAARRRGHFAAGCRARRRTLRGTFVLGACPE